MTMLATMGSRKFGRRRPTALAPRLKMSRYMRGNLPAPPPSVDYAYKAMDSLSNMYLNDQLGDCVIAGIAHLVGLFTANAGNGPTIFTDTQLIQLYSAIGGYRPGHPETDQGCSEQTALQWWQQYGAPSGTHRIAGWLTIDATNVDEVKQAIWLFENGFFGIEIPDAWVDVQNGFVWDAGEPNPNNGHAVVACGYDARGIQISTWGMVGTMTWAALARNVGNRASGGELYAVISQDAIIKASQRAPSGFSWASLVADFDAIGGHVPLPAPMPPVPVPPTPVPVMTGVTKAQVLAAVDLAINGLPWK